MHNIKFRGAIRIEKERYKEAKLKYEELQKIEEYDLKTVVQGLAFPPNADIGDDDDITMLLQLMADIPVQTSRTEFNIIVDIHYNFDEWDDYQTHGYEPFEKIAKQFAPIYIYIEENAEIDMFWQVQYHEWFRETTDSGEFKWRVDGDVLQSP